MTVRDKRLRRLANGRACVICNRQDGTVVGAHYAGFRQHSLGKGMGLKPSDLAIAHLCHDCHAEIDQYRRDETGVEHSERFLFAIFQTIERLWESGEIGLR